MQHTQLALFPLSAIDAPTVPQQALPVIELLPEQPQSAQAEALPLFEMDAA